jgi:hypothetical protein
MLKTKSFRYDPERHPQIEEWISFLEQNDIDFSKAIRRLIIEVHQRYCANPLEKKSTVKRFLCRNEEIRAVSTENSSIEFKSESDAHSETLDRTESILPHQNSNENMVTDETQESVPIPSADFITKRFFKK